MKNSIKPAIRVFCVMLTITGLLTATLLLPFRAGQAASLSGAGSLPASKHLAATGAVATSEAQAREAYGNAPVYFEANRGQVDSRADFIARGAGYSLFLTPTEAVYVLTPREEGAGDEETRGRGDTETRRFKEPPETTPVTKYALRMKIEGASAATSVSGLEELPGKVNYFRGNDPEQWQTNVPTYARVQYGNVYPGIDLVYYGREHQLEYDFVVAPGVDARQVSLRFEGADRVEVDGAGDLLLHAGSGVVRQQRPSVYQEVNGERRAVQSDYVLKGGGRVGFAVGAYDSARPLIIDPTVLAYSTYLGSGSGEQGYAIAVDSAGNGYITGFSSSDLFPTTAGAFQTTYGGGADAFVTKLNATGTALVYSTYLGGGNTDQGFGIAVDAAGNAYVTGRTSSSGPSPFPTTPGAFQTTNGGGFDAFVTELNPTGNALVYSTYLGGGGTDRGNGIAIDAAGIAYVTGQTDSSGVSPFPTTGGAFQTTNGGGDDAFVTKLKLTGAVLLYSTYLGGGGFDQGFGIAVDAAGNAYVTGLTDSSGVSPFPTTGGAFQTTNGGGGDDAFVTKLKPSGTALIYSTYLGGGSGDGGFGIAVDPAGNAYVTGVTSSSGASPFPTTVDAFHTTIGGSADAFVTKLNAAGTALVYSTYLGGGSFDEGLGIAVDAAGNAYVTGLTESSGGSPFPTTAGALQTTHGGSTEDAFMTKLNVAGTALVYSTYLGGDSDERGIGIAVDAAGNAYVTGFTFSTNYPVTDPAFQSNFSGGNSDAFVSKLGNYSISGRVIDQAGNPLGNVQMALSGARSKVTYTDLQGYFAFLNTSSTGPGANYNVVPARSGLAFTPTIQNISNFSHNVELYFTGFTGTPTGGSGGALAFTSPSFAVNQSETTATIAVTRLGAVTHADPVTVDYFTSDGTASERSDYIGAAGTLTFNFGERTKTFTVLIINNAYVRPTRTVNLILENPTAQASLTTPATAVLQINDNRTVEPPANPADDAAFFVRQQYYDFLDREPDAGGLAYWTNEITRCGTNQACLNNRRRDVSAAFFVEREFQLTGYFVYLMHKSSFAQQPGYLRFSRDRARVRGGSGLEANKTAFAEQWVAREDFLTRYPLVMTEDNYVSALNLNAGAVLTATEREALISGIRNGTETRATVLRKIADNAVFRQKEYNAAFVLMQYFGYLRREVDHGGYAFWLDILNNRAPGNFQGMVCAFITSAEYQDRFGSIHSHSNAECGQ